MIPLPWRLLAELATAAALLIAAFVAGHRGGVQAEHVRTMAVQHVLDVERAQAAAAAASGIESARAEERRRTLAIQEVADAAEIDRRAARADADRAAAAASSLRQRAAAYASACRGGAAADPAAAAASAPAADPGLVLADVLGRVEEAGRRAAALADERSAAGAACERAYDAVSSVGNFSSK